MIMLCIGGATGESRRQRRRESVSDVRDVPVTSANERGRAWGFYRRQRERKAAERAGRSSFERNESQRRVKDEYA